MKFKKFIIIFFGFLNLSLIWAYSAKDLVSESIYNELKSKSEIKTNRFNPEKKDYILLPKTELSKNIENAWNNEENPIFIGECLYLLPKTQLNSSNPDVVNIENTSKLIRSVSKMAGMEYFSDKKMKVLYKNPYTVKSATDKTRVPDDTSGSADGKELFCVLDDNSFGKTYYKLNYFESQKEVGANFCNISPISVGPIKAVVEDNLKISLLFIDCEDEFMVYLLVQSKFPNIEFLQKTMEESFTRRLDAIYNWFLKQW